MTKTALRKRTRKSRSTLSLTASAVCALFVAGCVDTTAASDSSLSDGPPFVSAVDSVAPAALKATIDTAFLTDVPTDQLDPVVVNAMAVASTPLTPEQNALLEKCLNSVTCDTGRGSLTVGFPNDNVNPWRSVFRAELTAQAIASPQVKRIIYNSANDVVGEIANIKSLIAQRADIIVMNTVYASAILPAVNQAKRAGIAVVQAQTPLPVEVAAAMDSVVAPDLCTLYSQAAKQVADAVKTASTYGLYTGIAGNSNAAVWQPCWQKTLNDAGWTQAVEGFTQWTPQGTVQAANALLASGRNPGAIVYDYTPDEFVKPYIRERRTPPVVMSDVVNYSWLRTFQEAKNAQLNPQGYVSNSQVWYGRVAVTAGVMIKGGEHVAKSIAPPSPTVSVDSVLGNYDPNIPANAPFPSLLTPEQITLALSVS
jgi:ABC-type sugar transport system substrate-binding protein